MPIFVTSDDAEEIAAELVEMVRQKLLPNLMDGTIRDRAPIGVGLTEVFCRAMLRTFPDPTSEGKDILEIAPKFVSSFPDPRRDAIHAVAKAKESSQLDN